MSRSFVRVVKVGGSLFDLPDLPDRLRAWLSQQPAAHHVLFPGGGPLADQVRQWHAVRPVEDVTAHWMCVELLSITAGLLHDWLPEYPLVDDDRELCRRVGGVGGTIFVPGPWLRKSEPAIPGTWLPPSWDVTSDSIAGRLAIALGANDLVLLKSTLPRAGQNGSLAALSASGYVDGMFATLATELPPIELVDFRSDQAASVRIEPHGRGGVPE